MVERVKELEHRGFQFEAADGSFDLLIRARDRRVRAALPARVVARDRREARGRQGPDRGHDQDLGRRRALRAHRGGQRPGQRARHGAARGDRRDAIRTCATSSSSTTRCASWTSAKGTGAVTRVLLDASDGADTWGAIGVSRERHRGELGGARRLARGRHAARPRRAPARRAERGPRDAHRRDPARPAGPRRAARRRRVLDVAALRPALARPARAGVRARVRRAARRAATPARSRPAPPACTSRCAPPASTDGDEVVTSPFSFVASANVIALRARAAGVRRHRPASRSTSTRTPPPRRSPTRTTGAAAGPHLRLPGRHAGVRARSALPGSSRTPARRWARCTPTARRSAGAATWRCSASTPNKQLTTGEGGMVAARRRRAQGARSTPSATRAARPTWAGSTTTGSASTTASRDLACALGLAQLERLDDMLAARARVAALVPRGAGRRSRASSCPARTRAATAAAGSSTWSSCRAGVDRDATIAALRERGVESKPYLPAIHLMSFYRERFGHRRGRVPGLRGRRRPLARAAVLPGAQRGAQVARVAEALGASWARRLDPSPIAPVVRDVRIPGHVVPELRGGAGQAGAELQRAQPFA